MAKANQNEWRRTVAELCEFTGLAPSTVRNAISGDRLKAEKDDQGRVLITESAFNEWREKSATNAPKKLVEALLARKQKNAEDRYLQGWIDFMDWIATGLSGSSVGTGISAIAKHEELWPAVAEIMKVAVRVLTQHDRFRQDSALKGVAFHLENLDRGVKPSPSASHESWLAEKEREGWKYGPIKNPETKEHPCFVPYDQLPIEQRLKDYIFAAIVEAFYAATATEAEVEVGA